MKLQAQIEYRRAVTYYEYWADKYSEILNATYLQTSHWGTKTVAKFFGYFKAYEDKPNMTARIKERRLWVVCVYDLHGKIPNDEQLHKKAMARLRKIERKLAEWYKRYNDAELWQ